MTDSKLFEQNENDNGEEEIDLSLLEEDSIGEKLGFEQAVDYLKNKKLRQDAIKAQYEEEFKNHSRSRHTKEEYDEVRKQDFARNNNYREIQKQMFEELSQEITSDIDSKEDDSFNESISEKVQNAATIEDSETIDNKETLEKSLDEQESIPFKCEVMDKKQSLVINKNDSNEMVPEEEVIAEHDLVQTEGIEELHKLAVKGDAVATLKISNIYIAYARNKKDYKKAFHWAKKAFQAGNVEANFLLGEIYQFGIGHSIDLIKAKRHYMLLLKNKNLNEILGPTTIADVYENYGDILLNNKSIKNIYLAQLYYKKSKKIANNIDEQKVEQAVKNWEFTVDELKEKAIYASATMITMVAAIVIVIVQCKKPATHLMDSLFHKALTVQAADQVIDDAVNGRQSGVALIEDNMADEYKYQLFDQTKFDDIGLQQQVITGAEATSEQVSEVGAKYSIENSYDGKKYTTWQEAEPDAGTGQSLTYYFDAQIDVKGIGIRIGNQRSEKAFSDSNRLENITIWTDKEEVVCTLDDLNDVQYIVFDIPIKSDHISIDINSVYKGESQKNITCITEIAFYQ